jgi:hypothetical protein
MVDVALEVRPTQTGNAVVHPVATEDKPAHPRSSAQLTRITTSAVPLEHPAGLGTKLSAVLTVRPKSTVHALVPLVRNSTHPIPTSVYHLAQPVTPGAEQNAVLTDPAW